MSGLTEPVKPPMEPVKISPARMAAFEVLHRVDETSAHSDDVLYGPALAKLSQQDKNLATALVLGVLRWEIALDARLARLFARPEEIPALPILIALRLGAFQLLHMDRIPAHAALSESVELVRWAGQPQAAGMVNAVLRKLTREPAPRRPLVESTAAMATRLGHPAWLVERWVKHFGRPAAEAICGYDQSEPAQGNLFASAEGLPHLDDGSRLVAELTAASMENPQRIWDACAAPGGKTMVLAQRHPGSSFLATDANPKRLRAMESRLKREMPEAKIRLVEADAARLPAGEGDFDLILCDVPCSGTGTLSRNPEIRNRLRATDLGLQAKRQREILSAALARLAPGGRLVYSTCSLEPEENEAVLAEILARTKEVGMVPVETLFSSLDKAAVTNTERLDALVRDGYLRTLPGVGFKGDGFFAAVLTRD